MEFSLQLIIILLLHGKFGKKENIIEAFYSQLKHLSMDITRFCDIKIPMKP